MFLSLLVNLTVCAPPVADDAAAAPPDDGALVTPAIVSTGSRRDEATDLSVRKVRVVDAQAIEEAGAEDAADALSTTVGARLGDSFRGRTVQLDGLPARYTLVLVDGRRVGGATDGEVDLARFRAVGLERIEVLRGPASTLYGSDAIGGVVNLITRRPTHPWEVTAHGQYGLLGGVGEGPGGEGGTAHLGDAWLSAGGRAGIWSGILRGDFHHSPSWDLEPGSPNTTGSAVERVGVDGDSQFEWRSGELRLAAAYQRIDSNGVDAADSGAVFDRRLLDEDLRTSAALTQRLGGGTLRIGIGHQYYRAQYRLDQRGSGVLDEYEESFENLVDASVQLDWLLPADNVLTVGFDGLFEHLASVRLEDDAGSRGRGAVFVQNDWTALDELVVVGGVRVDFDELFGVNVSPQLSLRAEPTPGLVLRGSFGLGYRAPRFKDLWLRFENPSVGYRVIGNPELQPESSIGGSFTLTWAPLRWLEFELDSHYHQITDQFTYQLDSAASTPGIDLYRTVNLAEAYSRGFTAQVRFGLPWLSARAGYTLSDVFDVTHDRRLAGRPLHRGTVDIVGRAERLRLTLTLRGELLGTSFLYEDTDGDGVEETVTESDPAAILGARVAWDYDRWVSVYLAADNLLDAGDFEHLPIRPFTIRAGVTVRLYARESR